jgi:hypothetical protein
VVLCLCDWRDAMVWGKRQFPHSEFTLYHDRLIKLLYRFPAQYREFMLVAAKNGESSHENVLCRSSYGCVYDRVRWLRAYRGSSFAGRDRHGDCRGCDQWRIQESFSVPQTFICPDCPFCSLNDAGTSRWLKVAPIPMQSAREHGLSSLNCGRVYRRKSLSNAEENSSHTKQASS